MTRLLGPIIAALIVIAGGLAVVEEATHITVVHQLRGGAVVDVRPSTLEVAPVEISTSSGGRVRVSVDGLPTATP